MRRSQKILLLTIGIICFGILIGACADFMMYGFWEETDNISMDVGQSKQRQIFVHSLTASPAQLSYEPGNLHIESAWIEARSRTRRHFWGNHEDRGSGYTLCFTLSQKWLPSEYMFVAGDDGWSVTGNRSQDREVFSLELDSIQAAHDVRLSLISDFNAPRPKDIFFKQAR